eukprot:GDKI01048396.1.p2 GENE.GDKI01048396.1~~GDKI01048396.1.p2  ORF type:complete len:658 (-),score=243.34 GDKI01048396.1:173-2146(-)
MRQTFVAALLLGLLCSSCVHAFFLPGVAPTEWDDQERVDVKVNSLTSVKTQLPYPYYHLPYCVPEDGIAVAAENLGEILTGDVIESSPYEVFMLKDEYCKMVCVKELNDAQRTLFRNMIDDEYTNNWIVDGLPSAMRYTTGPNGDDFIYLSGFPVGSKDAATQTYSLHNHVTIRLMFHNSTQGWRQEQKSYRIVGFEVYPRSIKHIVQNVGGVDQYLCDYQEPERAEEDLPPMLLEKAESTKEGGKQKGPGKLVKVGFTYDVEFEESSVVWASRWDSYLKMTDSQIHWFSIVNSVMVVLFLSGMVAMILLRTLLRDIARYNEMVDSLEELQEESGWKLVHGDVFRKPNFSKLLCVCVGSGIQILCMAAIVLVFSAIGILSPANRGGLLQAMLLLWTFAGFPAGYCAARIDKLFEGEENAQPNRAYLITLMTATLFPGVSFAIFFIIDLFLWHEDSSGAVSISTMVLLLILWFCISFPLVFMGSQAGYKKEAISMPVRTNQIPRQIPPQHWLTHPVVTSLIGGVLPFGAVFTELFFILSSIWMHQYYFLFGFLFLVILILVITCAEISIAFTYFQLTGEDYRWWWRSFLASGSSAIYVFLYSITYFSTRLNITRFVSTLLYFGYMAIISYSFFLLTGAIGFLATFIFVRAIYGSIKVD